MHEDRARLFGLGGLLRGELEAICRRLQITPQQAATLMIIGANEGTPMRKLAVLLGVDASNVTGVVDRLEAAGLVERYAEGEDRRVKRLSLTPNGRQRWKQVSAALRGPPAFMAALDADARAALREAIDQMIERTEDETEPSRRRQRGA